MSIELKPREWLLALWANGTFTVESEDAPCWQGIAPPAMIRAVAALPMEATIKELRASLAAAEATLADEVRHADELAATLNAACGHDANDYNCDEWPPGTPCRGCAGDKARELALAAHAARRAARDGQEGTR